MRRWLLATVLCPCYCLQLIIIKLNRERVLHHTDPRGACLETTAACARD